VRRKTKSAALVSHSSFLRLKETTIRQDRLGTNVTKLARMAFRPVALVCAENASDEHVDQLPTTPAGSNKLKIDMTPNGGGARRNETLKTARKTARVRFGFEKNGSKTARNAKNEPKTQPFFSN